MSVMSWPRRVVCRKTVKWFCVLLALLLCAGGGYGYWLWVHTDELLVEMILKKKEEFAPHWDLTIDRAHFDWNRRARLYNVELKAKGQNEPVLVLPEVVVEIDHDAFKQRQDIIIDRIRLVRPHADLVRNADGRWNWQELLLPKREQSSAKPLSEWTIENGSIRVTLEHTSGAEPGRLAIDQASGHLVPTGSRSYTLHGAGEINQAGHVRIKGEIDFERQNWSVAGTMQQLEFNGALLNLVAGTSVELRQNLARLETSLQTTHARLAGLPSDPLRSPFHVASRAESIPAPPFGPHTPPPERQSPFQSPAANPEREPLVAPTPFSNDPQLNPLVPQNRPEAPPWTENSSGLPNASAPPVEIEPSARPGSPDALTPSARNSQVPTAPVGRSDVVPDQPPTDSQPNVARSSTSISVPDFGLTALCDVNFRVGRPQPGHELEFAMLVDASGGTVTNPILPFPLRGLTGQIYWDNQHLQLRNLSARNGRSRIHLTGVIQRRADTRPTRLLVRLDEVPLDDRLRSRLPLELRRVYDTLGPAGDLSLQVDLRNTGPGRWQAHNLVASVSRGMIRAEKFPYPLTDVVGIIKQQGNDLLIELDAAAGGQPVAIRGGVRHPGITSETWLTITADRFPLDRRFVAACPPAGRKTLGELNLQGWSSGIVRLYRPPGRQQAFTMEIDARLFACQIEPHCFPYRLRNVAGVVRYRTTNDRWTFSRFQGEHDSGVVRAVGAFGRTLQGSRELSLAMRGSDLMIDKTLYLALPPSLQTVWRDFQPAGRIRDVQVQLGWQPGGELSVELPRVLVADGRLKLKAWPFAFNRVNAELSYRNHRLDIDSFAAQHEETGLSAKGFAHLPPGDVWRMRFTELFIDDLIPDRSFRATLPTELAAVFNELDPQEPLSLSGVAELAGTSDPRDPVTAAWDVEFVFSGNQLKVGVPLERVYGRVGFQGTWDGRRIDSRGSLDLSSASIWGYQFTNIRGPLRFAGSQLVVGSATALDPPAGQQTAIPLEDRLTAQAIGGTVVLDAVANLQSAPTWRLAAYLQNASLEEYARRYLPGVKNLRGVVNGRISLSGREAAAQEELSNTADDARKPAKASQLDGKGQIQISPAALYELPVITQVLQALVFNPPDRTAFKYAFVDFDVADDGFRFKKIDLVGDAISLRGQGMAKFDGRLNLDFYSKMPRNGLLRLPVPVVNTVVGNALDRVTEDWVRVEVRGRTNLPQAKLVAAPVLNDAVRRFLDAFGTGSSNSPRKTAVPFWDAFTPNTPRPAPPPGGQRP